MNLAEILSQGDSETVDFKASFNDEALETIGAYANAAGGVLLITVFCPMLVRHALFAACKTVETDSPRDGLTWLTTEVKEYASNRSRILVVWRDMTDLDPKAERAFLEADVAKLGDFEEKWINGDCAVPGFASLDGLFKRLMEHEA